jgi:hypothetical protein
LDLSYVSKQKYGRMRELDNQQLSLKIDLFERLNGKEFIENLFEYSDSNEGVVPENFKNVVYFLKN